MLPDFAQALFSAGKQVTGFVGRDVCRCKSAVDIDMQIFLLPVPCLVSLNSYAAGG